ncbi:adenosylcobinamide-GDP ribazoletransferase [Paraconexibacter sp.]|uniref:adenosylcobinamide-GDP ribazoletransferase n=1 Tax=Paraconexibacter sp. TaxID=2949640 RepID=UPI00356250EC
MTARARRTLDDARTAIAFLTRLRVGASGRLDAAAMSRAAQWFPAVGLIVGGALGGTRLLADLALDPVPATLLALLVAVLVTGGFHEDGLADIADAFGAHVSRERRLEILKDPRVGTYGALAIVFAIVFPLSVLAGLDGEHVLRAALVAHVLGRWSTLPHSAWWPPARPDGSGTLVRVRRRGLVVPTAFSAAVALTVAGVGPGLLALGTAILLTAGLSTLLARTFGGVTGDAFGAVNKLVELGTYAVLSAAWA